MCVRVWSTRTRVWSTCDHAHANLPETLEARIVFKPMYTRISERGLCAEPCEQVTIREVQYHMLGYGHTVWEAGGLARVFVSQGACVSEPMRVCS
jgi:hypothetical protein